MLTQNAVGIFEMGKKQSGFLIAKQQEEAATGHAVK
jgi:hypothetical protein